MSYRVVLYWGTVERGHKILDWVKQNCPSYEKCFAKQIDYSKNFSHLSNANMELWFHDEFDAVWTTLKWG